MKFRVEVVKTGCIFVEAETEERAVDIANNHDEDAVYSSGDWEVTGCFKDDSALDHLYLRGGPEV